MCNAPGIRSCQSPYAISYVSPCSHVTLYPLLYSSRLCGRSLRSLTHCHILSLLHPLQKVMLFICSSSLLICHVPFRQSRQNQRQHQNQETLRDVSTHTQRQGKPPRCLRVSAYSFNMRRSHVFHFKSFPSRIVHVIFWACHSKVMVIGKVLVDGFPAQDINHYGSPAHSSASRSRSLPRAPGCADRSGI